MRPGLQKPSTYYDPLINSRISAFLNAHRDYPVPAGHLLTMYVDPRHPEAQPGAVDVGVLSKEGRESLMRQRLDGSWGVYIVVQRGAEVLHERLAILTRQTEPNKDPGDLKVVIKPRPSSNLDQMNGTQNEIQEGSPPERITRFLPKPKYFDFETMALKKLGADGRPLGTLPRPCQWLSLANKLYPKLWRYVDDCRSKPNPGWPRPVFVDRGTVAGFLTPGLKAYLNRAQRKELSQTEIDALFQEVAILCALSSWRPTQGVYRFDPDLYEELLATPLTGDLPFELLYQLPEWCVYVETPHLEHYFGFFACLDYHSYAGDPEIGLFIVCDRSDGFYADVLPFSKAPLPEIVEASCTQDGVVHGLGLTEKQEVYQRVISLLLYLCASNAEIGRSGKRAALPAPRKTKDGWRLFSPDKPTTWDVGCRIGAALRRAKEQAAQAPDEALILRRSSKRPHIRRAHWHAFWHGPRMEPETRVLKLHWLHPIAVKVENIEQLPAVIRPVKES